MWPAWLAERFLLMKKITMGLRGLTWSVLASSLLATLPAWAVDPFTLRDIRIEGLQRIEPGTVFASLPFRIGDQYSDDKGSTAIRSLFGLGLFSDVRLQVNGEVLVVIVEERPSVADVSFSGIKEFDAEVLKKSLRDIGLTEGRPFDKALADRAEQIAEHAGEDLQAGCAERHRARGALVLGGEHALRVDLREGPGAQRRPKDDAATVGQK